MEEQKKELKSNEMLPAESGDDVFSVLPPEYKLKVKEQDLKKETLDIASKIVDTQEPDKLEDLTKLFEVNQSKKNVLRIIKLNDLLDTVNDVALDRVEHGLVSGNDLTSMMRTVNDSIKNSQDYITQISSKPMIQINNQHNEIKISGNDGLNQESKDKVINAVTEILASIQKDEKNKVASKPPQDVIDVKSEEKSDNNIEIKKENTDGK